MARQTILKLILKDFVANFSGAVQLVSEPKRGLANAHNAGCQHGEISDLRVYR